LKPVGWNVEMLSIAPDKLIVGERDLVIGSVAISAGVIGIGAVKFASLWVLFGGAGIAFFVMSMALVHRAWKADPWLSKTYARFRLYPSFIPAHASIASSESLRAMYRKRAQLKR
jgi:type IV secretory pathway TrbD component